MEDRTIWYLMIAISVGSVLIAGFLTTLAEWLYNKFRNW